MSNFLTFGKLNLATLLTATLVNTVFATTVVLGQAGSCRVDRANHAEYKLVFSHKNTLPPYMRVVRIVVKESNYSREYMLQLAKRLRETFCTDDEINVVIFDNVRAAKSLDMGQFLLGRVRVPELRGFYTLTDRGKVQVIQFSTQRGNPTNEVLIKLPTN